jgi:hypothetical protein
MNRVLWVVQVLLALLFLFAGAMKFVMPVEAMTKGMPAAFSSSTFIHFIGVCEVLGGIGLSLPALLRIKPVLTIWAAVGLLIIMIGAVVLVLPLGMAMAAFPFITALLLAFVTYGRWKLAPL